MSERPDLDFASVFLGLVAGWMTPFGVLFLLAVFSAPFPAAILVLVLVAAPILLTELLVNYLLKNREANPEQETPDGWSQKQFRNSFAVGLTAYLFWYFVSSSGTV